MDAIAEILGEYGALGAILIYFLWKDSKTFNLYEKTMREIVSELKEMRKDQSELSEDVEIIKEQIKKIK